jgi:hypothetical protein
MIGKRINKYVNKKTFFEAMFEYELGVNTEQTVRAASAYNKIISTVDEARCPFFLFCKNARAYVHTTQS